jgi:hypothetical protein
MCSKPHRTRAINLPIVIVRYSREWKGHSGLIKRLFNGYKVEAHVIRPVRIEGFLAEVEPGTRFELEKRPVADDIWLASHFSMKSNAKILLVFRHNQEEDDSYFNYQRAGNAVSEK